MALFRSLTDQSRRWAALPFLLAGAAFPVLDFFIVSILLPTIRVAMGADAVQTQMVASAFTGVYAVFLITGARLGDLYGRRRLFLTGVTGFAVASVGAAVAPDVNVLIAVRGLQGLFGALFVPQVLATLQVKFPPADRGRAIGLLGTAFSVGGIVAYLAGGFLVAWHPFGLGWQSVFDAYGILGLTIAAGGFAFIPESRSDHARGLDLGGVGLLFSALGALVVPLSVGRAAGWPVWTLVLLGTSPVLWATFVGYETRIAKGGKAPLVDMELFRDRVFNRGLVLALVLYGSYACMLCFSLYLRSVREFGVLDLAFANMPFALGFFFSSFFTARLLARIRTGVLVLGFSLMSLGWVLVLGSVLLGNFGTDLVGLVGLGVAGLGNGLVQSSLVKVVVGGMEPRHAGLGSGMLLSVQQLGGSLGVVLLGGLYFSIADASTALVWVLSVATGLLAVNALGALALSGDRSAVKRSVPCPEEGICPDA